MRMTLATLKRFTQGALGLTGLALALGSAPAAAQTRAEVTPYIEVQQVISAGFDDESDVLTYTSVAAGVDASVATRRVEAQISYRYERRIAWNDGLGDDDIHNGLAQARVNLIQNVLSLDGGALAARSRADSRGPVFGFNGFDNGNVAEVYSLSGGPTLSKRIGVLDVGAAYRLGYVKVDDNSLRGLDLPEDTPKIDRYDSSTTHNFSASVGMAPGMLPVGWTIGGGYVREDTNSLDQRFEGSYIRGDVVFPVTPTVALTGGVGYEDIESTQQDIRRDAGGVPITGPDGRLIADRTKPRVLAYDQSGLIWDAGVIWRPSRRTELTARVGRRYGGTTYTGSFRHEINSALGVQATVYDTVSSFGQLVVDDLSKAPVNFNVNRNPLNPGVGGVGGCVFGKDAGTGTCFDDAFQSINTSNFHIRGANVLVSGGRGPWQFGLGAGYSNRKYVAPGVASGGFTLDGVTDESFSLSASASRDLTRTSGITVDGYATWFDSGIRGAGNAFSTGVTGSYYRSLIYDQLQAHAAVGVYTTDSGPFDSTEAAASIGLRYTF